MDCQWILKMGRYIVPLNMHLLEISFQVHFFLLFPGNILLLSLVQFMHLLMDQILQFFFPKFMSTILFVTENDSYGCEAGKVSYLACMQICKCQRKLTFILSLAWNFLYLKLLVESWKIFCSFFVKISPQLFVTFGSMPLDSGGVIILDLPYSFGYQFL